MNNLYVSSFENDWGRFYAASTEKGLTLLSMPGEKEAIFDASIEKYFADFKIVNGNRKNSNVEKQLKKYFNHQLKKFDLKLNICASPFHQKALKQVYNIRYGTTASYGDIARAIGSPRAYRAVGTANAKNKIPLIIPCHRVVATNGIGGYGGGLNMKKKLLKFEGVL